MNMFFLELLLRLPLQILGGHLGGISILSIRQVSKMARLHQALGPAIEDHFRLFAALIAGAAPVSEGPLPQRGRRIFPAQCWKDLECAKVVAALCLADIL